MFNPWIRRQSFRKALNYAVNRIKEAATHDRQICRSDIEIVMMSKALGLHHPDITYNIPVTENDEG
jgi:hypothetical protein